MVHIYLLILVGLCSFEARSLEPVSPGASPHASPTKKTHRSAHVVRSSKAKRRLLFAEQEAKGEVGHALEVEKQERTNHIIQALNQLYQHNVSAYNSVSYFLPYRADDAHTIQSKTDFFHDRINYSAREHAAHRKYKELFNRLELLNQEGVLHTDVQYVYENSTVALLNPDARPDEQRYGLVLPPQSPRGTNAISTITLPVPLNPENQDNEQLEVDARLKIKYHRRVADFTRNHPHKAQLIPALFDKKQFDEFNQQHTHADHEWRMFLKTLRDEKLTTKNFHPTRGLRYLYQHGLLDKQPDEVTINNDEESDQLNSSGTVSDNSLSNKNSSSQSLASSRTSISEGDDSSYDLDDLDMSQDRIDDMVERLKQFNKENSTNAYKILGLVDYDCYDVIMQLTTHDEWDAFKKVAQSKGLLTQEGKPAAELFYVYDNGLLGDGFAELFKKNSLTPDQIVNDNQAVVLSKSKLKNIERTLHDYKQKHPNKYRMIPALFNQSYHHKITKTEQGKQSWSAAMQSYYHNGLIDKSMKPSLELTYLYCKACNKK